MRRTLLPALVALALGGTLAAVPATTGSAAVPAPTARTVTAAPAVPESRGFDPARFENPRKDSLPAVYWYWGGVITDDIIDLQMAELRDKGIWEVVLFPFNGEDMRPLFASEEWFDRVGHTLEVARDTGMKVWLFNDNNFPSGRGAMYVVNGGQLGDRTFEARPDLRLKGLWRSTSVVTGGGEVALDRSTGVAVEHGRLVADGQVAPGGSPVVEGTGWGDYTLAANDVRVSSTTAGTDFRQVGTAAGLLVRASADGRSGYVVRLGNRGALSVARLDDGVETQLSAGTEVPGFTYTRPRKVSVVVAGDTITPVLDGRPQPPVTDATYPVGSVATYATGLERTAWGDLTVTGADEQVLWSADFEDSSSLGDLAGDRALAADAIAATAQPVGARGTTGLVELTPQLDGDGRPTWQAPAGRWRIDLFGASTLVDDSRGYTRGYLDLLSEEATDAFLSTIPEEYVRRFGWAMGTTVPGFWDDEPFVAAAEPHPFKRQPWSPTLAGELAELGTSPGKAYLASYDDLGRGGEQLRGQYWQAVSNRFAEAYYKRQADWMADHGLKLISNPLLDELSPSDRLGNTGDITKDNQWAQVPGTDMITTDYTAGEQTMLTRNAASVAHQSGQPRVVMEVFGNSGWKVAPEYMHATMGALAVRGANLPFLHALWTDELRVIFAPPFGPRSTFWEDMGGLNAWTGRVMEIARGRDLSRTALVQPQDAAEQLHEAEAAEAVDDAFAAASEDLERSQVDFDLVHDGALSADPALREHASVSAGELLVGRADYDVVVLPETPVLDLAAVRTLTRFVRSGGTLVTVGDRPTSETRGWDKALRTAVADLIPASARTRRLGKGSVVRVARATTAGEAVSYAGAAALTTSTPAPSLRVARRGSGPDLAYLINNESDQPVRTTATFPTRGLPELWDPATGTTGRIDAYTPGPGTTTLPLELDPYETVAIVFQGGRQIGARVTSAGDLAVTHVRREGPRRMTARVQATEPGFTSVVGTARGVTYRGRLQVGDPLEPLALDGPWTVRLEQDGAEETERPLGSWTTFAPTFSGSAVYRSSVTLRPGDLARRRLVLDLGEVHDLATVTVNGRRFAPAYWRPYAVDVTSALRAGANTVEVRVTNTLANERNQNLPSGLVGPVSLRPVAVRDVRLWRTP